MELKTQKDFMKVITRYFKEEIDSHERIFRAHDYCNNDYYRYVKTFMSKCRELGVEFKDINNTGIGNNNQYQMVILSEDQDGFIVEKTIGYYFYVTGIYGGVESRLFSKTLDNQVALSGRAS